MLERAEQVGWYWQEADMRLVMDDFGEAIIIPFCAEYGFDQLFDYI
jgi:hypothetical protein